MQMKFFNPELVYPTFLLCIALLSVKLYFPRFAASMLATFNFIATSDSCYARNAFFICNAVIYYGLEEFDSSRNYLPWQEC